jgi:ParB-like chromosome segregation protein Spo0J
MKWNLKQVPTSQITEWTKNPRILRKQIADHLQGSLDEFGMINEPILNKDFTIIGGHQRIRLLIKGGAAAIECKVADVQLNQRQAEKLALLLNKATADWDWDKLANEFDIESLLAGGFETKDFTGKGEKESKPSVSFVFDSQEELEQATDKILGLSLELEGCKVRVKNGK